MYLNVVFILIFLLRFSIPCHAADNAISSDVLMRQLISEIRLLRHTIQQSLQLQVSVEQVKYQREVIFKLRQQMESAADEAANHTHNYSELEEIAKDLEAKAATEPPNQTGPSIKIELHEVNKSIAQAKYQITKMREKEQSTQAALSLEESRLAELIQYLNSQLSSMQQ